MSSPSSEAMLRELWSREQIKQVMLRYCRGCDRCDKQLLLSAYHPGAHDDHGTFKGSAEEFVEWADALHQAYFERTAHIVTNHLVEFDADDSDVARGETYVTGWLRSKTHDMVAVARYLDRFECRNGDWRIADRVVVIDWVRTDPVGALADIALAETPSLAARSRQDPSYRILDGAQHAPVTFI